MAEGTGNLVILLKYQYLMHDIDQWTFRLAQMRVQDEEKRAESQSGNDTTDASYYRRKITEAIAKIRALMKNRLETKPISGDDTLGMEITGWRITLKQTQYDCDAQTITDLMHKYIVRSVIVDWSLTYAPDATNSVSTEMQAIEKELFSELYNRKRPQVDDNEISTESIVEIS